MTTLYRPVLIESAEQAEQLPIGTVAVNPQDRTEASVRVQNGWHVTGQGEMDGTPSLFKHRDMVGDLALVPIEAEEERQAIAECEIGVPGTERIVHEHRFVTPWEER